MADKETTLTFDPELNAFVKEYKVLVPMSWLDGVPLSLKDAQHILATNLDEENYEACAVIQAHIDKYKWVE